MKAFLILIAAVALGTTASAADKRNVAGAVVDLAPIYEWEATNGPTELRPLVAWKQILILGVGDQISVYRRCLVNIDGVKRQVLMDHLPAEVISIYSNRARLEARKRELESFIPPETKRLRSLDAQAWNWDVDSADYQRLRLDQANLRNRKDELEETDNELGSLGRKAATVCLDYAVLMNRKYVGLEIWDIGLKR